jgi:hypothetical protein
MSDEVWQELLQSPLDDNPRRDGDASGGRRGWWLIPLSVFVGGVVAFAGLLLADAGNDEVAVATTTTTTTVAGADEPERRLPDGYVQISIDGEPVQGSVGVRPEMVYAQDDDLYVTLSSVVRSMFDPDRVAVFPGGDWSLQLDGAALPFSGEITNPLSLGLVTVRFDDAGGEHGAGVLRLRPVVRTDSENFSEELTFNGLPDRIEGPFEYELEEGITLVVDEISLGAESGTVRWHLEALPNIRARVDAVVEFPETISAEGGQTALAAEHLMDPYPFQRPPKPTPNPAWRADEVLRRVGPELEDPAAITRGLVRLSITWQTTSTERVIEIPVVVAGV